MNKFFFTFVACLLFFMNAGAQHSVSLQLLDDKGATVPAAGVTLKDAEGKMLYAAQADDSGRVSFSIDAFPVQAEIDAFGYISRKIVLNQHNASQTIHLQYDPQSLNEVVVTGVGRPTRVDEAVSVYRIIDKDAIRNQGAVSLNDALRNQIGLNINSDQMLGSSVTMRGLSGNNVKILVDGLPVNGRENGNIDLTQLNLYNIERIEMVQGPMSIMYGSDALGGVINLITKNDTNRFTNGFTTFYESIGKYNFSVNNSTTLGKHSLSFNLARNYFQGWDTAGNDVRNPLWRPKEQYLGNFKYVYKFNEKASVSYALDFLNEKLTIKGGTGDYSYYNRTVSDMYFHTTRFINRLQAKWMTGKNGYWESNNSFANYNRVRKTYITDLSTMDRTLSTVVGDNTEVVFNDITSRTTFNNKVGIVNYTLGYDINYQIAKGGEKLSEGDKHIGDFALFLTTDIKVLPKLTVQPAIRYGYNTGYQAPFAPSFSFLYKATPDFSLRGSYARGFRAPGLKEMYLDFRDFNHSIIGNENLKAEYGNHFQMSGAYSLLNREKSKGTVSLTGFYDDVTNQIALVVNNPDVTPVEYMYGNIGRTRFLSMQLRGEFRFNNLVWNTGLSYNNSFYTVSYDESGNGMVTPDFHYVEANTNLTYNIPKWNAGASVYYKYTGSQPMLGSDITGNAIFGSKANAFHNIDASLNKSFWQNRILLTAGVRNITDNVIINYAASGSGGGHGVTSGMTLTPGRSFFASLGFQIGS